MIYLVEAGPFCKVGYTRSSETLTTRISALKTASPHEVVLVEFFDGSLSLEKAFHRAFKEVATRGEWYLKSWVDAQKSIFGSLELWLRSLLSEDEVSADRCYKGLEDYVPMQEEDLSLLCKQPNLRYPTQLRNAFLIRLVGETGARPSEFLQVKVLEFDHEWGEISISGKYERVLPVSEECVALFKLWMKARKEHQINSDLLFVTLKSTPINPRQIRTNFQRYGEKCGLSCEVNAAELRRVFARRMLRLGVDVLKLSYLLGVTIHRASEVYEEESRRLLLMNEEYSNASIAV